MKVPSEFTSYEECCFDILDTLPLNDITLDKYANFDLNKNAYTNWVNIQTKITRIINRTSWVTIQNVYIKELDIYNTTWNSPYHIDGIKKIDSSGAIFYAPNLTSLSGFRVLYSSDKLYKEMYFPKLTNFAGFYGFYKDTMNTNGKIFFGASNCVDIQSEPDNNWNNKYRYFPATALDYYLRLRYLSTYPSFIIGVIDGADTYTDKNFDYPKLTGVDTEENILLLTPTEDVLYLASDTGNLWQYDSANSQWVNLFSGYTVTWYSNEDCTTTIQPSDITSDMTVFVKLSAI